MAPNVGDVENISTGKLVRFCLECTVQKKCKTCEKSFQMKNETEVTSPQSTCYQLESDITSLFSEHSKDMIVDIGSPLSLVGLQDEDIFKQVFHNFSNQI